MSNATDSLIEAEEMIRSAFSKIDDQDITLQICRWLLDFNSIEKGFKIKCYSTNIPDICFCVDRGGDCETEKVRTWFFRIRPNQGLYFKLIKPYSTYLKLQSGRGTNTDNTFITYSESKKLNIEIIKKHILESYQQQLNKLNLVSNLSSTNNALEQNREQHLEYADLPSKEDIDFAESQLRKNPDEIIGMAAVLDQIEINFEKTVKPLKENWREITKKNISKWFINNSKS